MPLTDERSRLFRQMYPNGPKPSGDQTREQAKNLLPLRCRLGGVGLLQDDDKKIRKTFASRAEAKTWRDDANAQLARGGLRAPKPTTIREAWDQWYEGARAGTIRNRSGDPFKPSALRAYEGAMRREVLPEFGATKLASLTRPDLQQFADRLMARGLSPSSIQRTLLPVRALYRRALSQGDMAVDPAPGCTFRPSGAAACASHPRRKPRV